MAMSSSRNLDVSPPEPIFKLEWFLQDELSWLAVMGGLVPTTSDSSEGVCVYGFEVKFFQDKNMPDNEPHRFLYPTAHAVQDFSIFSSDTGASIYIISGSPSTSSVEAFQYPPTLPDPNNDGDSQDGNAITVDFSAEFEESAEISKHLASTLDDLKELAEGDSHDILSVDRIPALLPLSLYGGSNAIVSVQIIQLDSDAYSRLAQYASLDADVSPFHNYIISFDRL